MTAQVTPPLKGTQDRSPGFESSGKACASNSEEFPAMTVGKNDEEEESGDCGDEEESPEKPAVDGLCKHFPLSSDVVVPSLHIFLFQETLHNPHQIVLFSLPNSSVVDGR